MGYNAPVDDILLALKAAGGLDRMIEENVTGGLDSETIASVLEEAGRFASGVLEPLNRVGDEHGSRLVDGKVVTPPGWQDAYSQFAAQGWTGLSCPSQYGGQELPAVVAMPVCEIWNAANMAFGMCPLLTSGAIDALHIGGSDELKTRFLPRMISGEWTGTMNLTEPQAGSDLNAITSKAIPNGDGTYRISGTKIFISYGDHDLTPNIIHLVLARLPDAPPGTKGISLFLVPKRLVGEDGSLGAENDVVCAGLEHKLGIRASPTAVLKFGETGGAIGYLVGEENRGLHTMFIMMNAARLAVGIQGVSIADRATQRAVGYAAERRQGRTPNARPGEMSPIAEHPDIRRTLLSMAALTQAARCICIATAAATDLSHRAAAQDVRQRAADRVALLTPIAKAFATDAAVEVASLGIQVHGGMGYVEETGAAQHLRDARILPIYEGTNGIQAIDLVMRKIGLSGGEAVTSLIGEVKETSALIRGSGRPELEQTARHLDEAVTELGRTCLWMAGAIKSSDGAALAGATPFLRLFAVTLGAHYLARCALAGSNSASAARATALAQFFASNFTITAPALASSVIDGADVILGLNPEMLVT